MVIRLVCLPPTVYAGIPSKEYVLTAGHLVKSTVILGKIAEDVVAIHIILLRIEISCLHSFITVAKMS